MFRPVSNSFSAAKGLLPVVFSRPASYKTSQLYQALLTANPSKPLDYYEAYKEQLKFISIFKAALRAEVRAEEVSWEEKTTPLHLIATLLPPNKTRVLQELAGEFDPEKLPPHYENTVKPFLEKFIVSQDDDGNTPIHIAIDRKNWELANFLGDLGIPVIENNAGVNPAWAMLKAMPIQLNTTKNFFDPDACYKLGDAMVGNRMLNTHENDENNWNLVHWYAFKGYRQPYHITWMWRLKDNQGLTPGDIEHLIHSIDGNGAGKGEDGSMKSTKTPAEIFSKLPKERQEELGKIIRERLALQSLKVQKLSSILSPYLT